METNAIAPRIRAFRKLKGLTQTELAGLLGVSIAILGAIERGTKIPDPQIIDKISEVLHVDREELFAADK
jgi:transcriptional regulator with XRE-family HTH domain